MNSSLQIAGFMAIVYAPLVIYCTIKVIKDTYNEYKEIKRLIETGNSDLVVRRYDVKWRKHGRNL